MTASPLPHSKVKGKIKNKNKCGIIKKFLTKNTHRIPNCRRKLLGYVLMISLNICICKYASLYVKYGLVNGNPKMMG